MLHYISKSWLRRGHGLNATGLAPIIYKCQRFDERRDFSFESTDFQVTNKMHKLFFVQVGLFIIIDEFMNKL